MDLLSKKFLEDPVGAIEQIVNYTKSTGQPSSFVSVRNWLYQSYLTIDAKTGTDYAAAFATATGMTVSEQKDLRYKWAEQEEKLVERQKEFQKDPQWMGKESIDWVIAIQEQKEGEAITPEDAKVISAKKIHLNINDFLKAMFLYVSRKERGFVCKASEFNMDSYKFSGKLRIFF